MKCCLLFCSVQFTFFELGTWLPYWHNTTEKTNGMMDIELKPVWTEITDMERNLYVITAKYHHQSGIVCLTWDKKMIIHLDNYTMYSVVWYVVISGNFALQYIGMKSRYNTGSRFMYQFQFVQFAMSQSLYRLVFGKYRTDNRNCAYCQSQLHLVICSGPGNFKHIDITTVASKLSNNSSSAMPIYLAVILFEQMNELMKV